MSKTTPHNNGVREIFFFFWVAERQREKSKEKAEGKCHADC